MNDPILEWMRSQGLPDPGTPEADEWVYWNIEHEGVIDFAVFVPAWICHHRSDDPLREVEIGSRATLPEAIDRVNEFGCGRIVPAWQEGDGLYHYGKPLYEVGPFLSPWDRPIDLPSTGAHRRS